MIRKAPTAAVICSVCGRELRGTECEDGFRVRNHRNSLTERRCDGAYRIDHQPVVVFRSEAIGCRRALDIVLKEVGR